MQDELIRLQWQRKELWESLDGVDSDTAFADAVHDEIDSIGQRIHELAKAMGKAVDDDAGGWKSMSHYYPYIVGLRELYVSSIASWVKMVEPHPYIPCVHGDRMMLTNFNIYQHLAGTYGVSVFASPYSSKFLTFDVDLGADDLSTAEEACKQIIDALEGFGVPRDLIYVSFSGNKGYHVDLFFDDLVYTKVLRKLYDAVIERTGFSPAKVEFRPTASQAIKLPLGVHHKTGERCWFINLRNWKPIEDLNFIFEIRRIEKPAIIEIVNVLPEHKRENPPKREMHVLDKELAELANLDAPGQTHHTMCDMAVWLHYEHLDADENQIREWLVAWLHEQDGKFLTDTIEEYEAQAASIAAWVTSPKFVTHQLSKGKPWTVSRVQMQVLLEKNKTKHERRILMLILLFQNRYGSLRMKQNVISQWTGGSYRTVYECLQRLEKDGVIEAEHGDRRCYGGKWAAHASRYRLIESYDNMLSDTDWGFLKDSVEVEDKLTPESFDEIYYRILREFLPPHELRLSMSKSEWKHCKELMEVHANAEEDHTAA